MSNQETVYQLNELTLCYGNGGAVVVAGGNDKTEAQARAWAMRALSGDSTYTHALVWLHDIYSGEDKLIEVTR